MGPPTYMRSVADRNVVMRRLTVLQQLGTAGMVPRAATLHAVSVVSRAHTANKDAASDASLHGKRTRSNLHKGGNSVYSHVTSYMKTRQGKVSVTQH